jgi:hypothetical protein
VRTITDIVCNVDGTTTFTFGDGTTEVLNCETDLSAFSYASQLPVAIALTLLLSMQKRFETLEASL